MPTDDPRDSGRLGFHNYADDTPRDAAPAPSAPDSRPDAPPRTGVPWMKAAAGVAVLAAFGGGYLAAHTGSGPSSPPRPVSEAAAVAAAPPMNIEVAQARPLPAPAPSTGDKLEVLPPGRAPAILQPRQAPVREAALLPIAPILPAPAPQELAPAPPARDVATLAPVREACADAPTPARQMVCRDGGLAEMDRRMRRAYAAALAAGAREDVLAADQADWLDVREVAAERSRWPVANIYRQRIEELQAIADGEQP